MATRSDRDTTEVTPPGYVLAGVRTALEMALVGLLAAHAATLTTNPYLVGAAAVGGLVGMTVVLFWALNRQMEAWVARARRTGRAGE